MPIFKNTDGNLQQLNSLILDKEKSLQQLIERNLLQVLDMHFLVSEYPTTHGGRIDTLAIDSDGAPVIIEYKRNRNDNVINQALSYLKWLKAQKEEFFEMLVIKRLGAEKASKIDWKNPRVICIAESYSKFDIDTLEVIPLRLELHKFVYYENDIFSLEKINNSHEEQVRKSHIEYAVEKKSTVSTEKLTTDFDINYHTSKGLSLTVELFNLLQEKIFELDETIEEKVTGNYIAYRVSKSFAEIHIQKNRILLYLRPVAYNDPEGRIHKIPDSYNWSLDRRVYIGSEEDLKYVMKLIEQSYRDVI